MQLVAEHTGHTRVTTRRQLAELLALATEATAEPQPRASRGPRRAPPPDPVDPIEQLVTSLESHLDELTRQIKADVTPLAIDTARRHLGLTLLLAAGVGLMVGLFLGALGYPHDLADGDLPDGDPRDNEGDDVDPA